MKPVRSTMVAVIVATMISAAAAAGATNDLQKAMAGIFHVSEARGPIRPADLSPFKGAASGEILAGPTNGLESAYLIYSRLAPGGRASVLYTLPVDHTYLVLAGKLNVQLGTEKFVVGPETLVLVPAGVPHRVWNDGSEQETDFQVITPAPSRDLVAMMKPAAATRIENAAQYIRVAPPLGKLNGGTGHDSLNERILANRATGSEHVLERLNDMLQGGGRTETHLHPFDQAYFIRQGTMTVQYGMATYKAPANSLVIIPTGVVHNNLNNEPTQQSVITLLLPEPEKGNPMGSGVTLSAQGRGGQ